MTDRHLQLERQLDHYAQSLTDMRHHVSTLEHQLLDMLKIQFGRLAAVITDTLQLPQEQATILRGLVDDHLRQLAVTAQLQPPKEQHAQQTPAFVHGNLPPQSAPPRQHTRDPRLIRSTQQTEG